MGLNGVAGVLWDCPDKDFCQRRGGIFPFRQQRFVTGFDFGLSSVFVGIGHLVGLWVGVAMLIGAIIGWDWGIPHFSARPAISQRRPPRSRNDMKTKVRFVGAGAIGISAIWTLDKLIKPVVAA